MKKSNDGRAQWPRRLRDDDGEIGPILRSYMRQLDSTEGEAAAFARTSQALPGKTPGWRLATTVTLASAILIGLGLVVLRPQRQMPTAVRPVAVLPVAPMERTNPSPDHNVSKQPTRSLRVQSKASALPVGKTEISNEATVILHEAGRATAQSQRQGTTIVVGIGRIDLQVLPRPVGHPFSVKAGPFTFVVVGTAFSVTRQGDIVTLDVTEGCVRVVRQGQTLASISKGHSWASDDGDAKTTTAVPAPTEAVAMPKESAEILRPQTSPTVTLPSACSDLAKAGHTRDAIACFERRAADGNGADNDLAAYEAARLWKDGIGDLESARRAFETYRRQFPRGVLHVEATLSLVEILPRLGLYHEALTEAGHLLADPRAAPRHPEMHLVRGNILRTTFRDTNAALIEYRAASAGDGKTGDEGAYLYAVCLEELDRRIEAGNAFARYLARPAALHAVEAKQRKQALSKAP